MSVWGLPSGTIHRSRLLDQSEFFSGRARQPVVGRASRGRRRSRQDWEARRDRGRPQGRATAGCRRRGAGWPSIWDAADKSARRAAADGTPKGTAGRRVDRHLLRICAPACRKSPRYGFGSRTRQRRDRHGRSLAGQDRPAPGPAICEPRPSGDSTHGARPPGSMPPTRPCSPPSTAGAGSGTRAGPCSRAPWPTWCASAPPPSGCGQPATRSGSGPPSRWPAAGPAS